MTRVGDSDTTGEVSESVAIGVVEINPFRALRLYESEVSPDGRETIQIDPSSLGVRRRMTPFEWRSSILLDWEAVDLV